MEPIAIRPCKDRRVILHHGGQTLDGLAIAPGSDCPAQGALVDPGIWVRRRLDDGDLELVPARSVRAGDRQAAKREALPGETAADTTTDPAGAPT